jgi:hypothetical protein
LAVRDVAIRLWRHHVHRIPFPTSVTIMSRPPKGNETAGKIAVIWVWREAIYFCKEDWTTQISLIRFTKLDFWRKGLRAKNNGPSAGAEGAGAADLLSNSTCTPA